MSQADLILDAFAAGQQIGLLSDGEPLLDEDAPSAIAAEVHARRRQRGEHPVGRKIGFTNRSIWPQYGVWTPIWGYVYDSTIFNSNDGTAPGAIGHPVPPRRETQSQTHLA